VKYLLDTNVILWYISGDNRLPVKIRSIIDNSENELFVSAASIWEISIKYNLGQLDLLPDFDTYLDKYIFSGGYNILPIDAVHAKYVSDLEFFQKDPFDRIIYAQSVVENLILLYTDSIFEKYTGA
jgi:PIN domain nuclease of toxin-antitoxin system